MMWCELWKKPIGINCCECKGMSHINLIGVYIKMDDYRRENEFKGDMKRAEPMEPPNK